MSLATGSGSDISLKVHLDSKIYDIPGLPQDVADSMNETILLVEDDPAIVDFLRPALEREGFAVRTVGDGEAALVQARRDPPSLILLDWELPGLSGLEVCRRLREREPYIPVIMLTVREQEPYRVVGLESGADDYVTKPFSMRELVARIRAVLRLTRQAGVRNPDILHVDQLVIDRTSRTVTLAGTRVDLAPKEFDLLATLARERGRAFGREMLLERVWGYDYAGETRTIDVHVQRLRHKIEPDPAHPRYLLTVHGLGYKFAAEEDL